MNILALSGFVPEEICDTVRFEGYTGDISISQYCGYAADFIAQVLRDDSVDGAVFPRSCDSSRIIRSYIGDINKFVYQIAVPARRDDAAEKFFSEEIRRYKKALESYYNIELTDIEKRAEAVNVRNAEIKNIYDRLEYISYSEYLSAIHKMLKKPLTDQEMPVFENGGGLTDKKVYIIGSFMTSENILKTVENSGLNIVGDNLPESGRIAGRAPVDIGGDIYNSIARSILSTKLSPTQNNFRNIIENDINEMKKKEVRGVIFITQKHCEPYDYLYSVYDNKLKENGIKTLKISLANSEDSKNHELAIEAFSDMV